MTQDLQEIIGRAQRGDRDAFSRLVEDHYALIFRFACRYCGDRQDAEDVTQQACVKLARTLVQFRFESAFSTWLYRLVINCARDWLKSQHRRESVELDDMPVSGKHESTVLLQQVMVLVDTMGEGFRDSVVLVLGMGMTHAEAAAILEVKESTVSWRLHEIRKRLNDQVQPGVDQ